MEILQKLTVSTIPTLRTLGGMLGSGKRVLVTADPGAELSAFVGDCAILSPPGDPIALAAAILTARTQDIDIFADHPRLSA
jgi:hypothetical protein